VEISFLFCDDEKIRDLNAIWNDKDYATNVLSFPAAPNKIKTPVTLLGDVILAFDTISKEALEQDKTISSHAAHMLVHGVLHLFGYDHLNDIDADRMESVETRVLHTMGIADPWVSFDSSRS
jgi:probable rRNA maturation factor